MSGHNDTQTVDDVGGDLGELPPDALGWGNEIEAALAMHITEMVAQDGDGTHEEDEADDGTGELRDQLLRRLRELVPEDATADTLVPGASSGEVTSLLTLAGQLADEIPDADRDRLDELDADIESLAPGLQRAQDAVAKRQLDRKEIEERGKAVTEAGSTPDQKDRLAQARKTLGDVLALPLTDQSNVNAGREVGVLEQLAEAVQQEELDREALVTRLGEVVPGTTAEELVPGAMAEDLSDVLETAKQLGLDIAAAKGSELAGLGKRIDELEPLIEAVETEVGKRQTEHKRIAGEGAKVEVSGHLDDQKQRLADARKDLAKALESPVTPGRNKTAGDALLALQDLAKAVTEELDSLGGEAGIGQLCAAVGFDASAYAALETALGGRKATAAMLKTFTPAKLGGLAKGLGGGEAGAKKLADLAGGFGGPAGLADTVASLDPGGQDRLLALVTKGNLAPAAVTKLRDDLGVEFLGALMGDSHDPAAAIAIQAELGGNVKALQDLATDGGFAGKPKALAALYSKGCGGDAKVFAALCVDFGNPDDRAKLKGLVDGGGLGDAPDCLGALLATGCGGSAAKLKEMGTAFADPLTGAASRDGLKRMLTTGGLAAGKGTPPDGDVDPACLGQMLKQGGGAQLAKLVAGLDATACGNVAVALKKGGLGTEPEAFAALVDQGCGKGDPAKLGGLVAELNTGPAKLKGLNDLLKEGGVGGKDGAGTPTGSNAECLAKLFAPGCDGKPAELAKLLTALGPDDLANMKGVMTTGGLGKAPDSLAQLLAKGCDGDPAKFKAFGTAFADPLTGDDSRKGLERLLTTGGLAAGKGTPPDGDVDSACLGLMFKNGGGPQLAKLAAGLDATACGNIGATLKKGGLGTEPEVFAKLVDDGCGKGDPAELGALAAELNSDPAKLKGLDDLLKTGGFGTKDETGTATNIKTDCLAKLFAPGCDGKPAELTKLLTALTGPDLANMKGLMTAGGLGQRPDIIGPMYKHGCISDPDGADDGTKEPTVLKDMMGEFAGPVGAGQFKDLLDNGGLGETGKQDRLGSLMRYACSNKANPGAARNGKVLKQFHTAFSGNMADLTTTMEAFETAPKAILENGSPNQPGKAFRNVVNAPGHGNGTPDATRLHSKFFTTLKNQSIATTGLVIAPGSPARLTLKQLLQNTPTFEQEAFTAGSTPMVLGGRNIDFRIDHVMDRHTRKFNTFDFSGSTKSTLYPRTETEAGVKARLTGTWANIPNIARGDRPAPPPGVPKANPPMDIHDLEGNYTPYPWPNGPVPPGVNDGQGAQAKIGFNPAPPPIPPAVAPPIPGVYIAQFFAVDSGTGAAGEPDVGGLLTVHKTDMLKMKSALT